MTNKKNPAAVALGRLGGRKSAEARMKKLTPQQRSEIAKKCRQSKMGEEGREII